MKTRAYTILACFLAAGLAHAGFRHPVDDTGLEAQQIESTPVHPAQVVPSRPRAAQGHGASSPSSPSAAAAIGKKAVTAKVAETYGPAVPKNYVAKLPANVKQVSPARQALRSALKNPMPVPNVKPVERHASREPVAKAPELPAADHIKVPEVSLPNAPGRDGLLSMQAPEKLFLEKGLNRPHVYAFLKHARDLPLPSREYATEVRSRPIAEQYRAALHPEPGKSFRTPYSLKLAKVGKIQEPYAVIQYENAVKRIDALFMALDIRYAKSVTALWQLAESPTNSRDLQARDALFAGLISDRAGWDTVAAMMYQEAAEKGVEHGDRYLKILWSQLQNVPNPVHLDKIVAAVSPLRVRDTSPAGDRANFAMAKRLLMHPNHVPYQVFPSYEVIQQRIQSAALRDKLSLIHLVAELRGKNDKRRLAAVDSLRAIESADNEENSQEARLALARTMLQHGEQAEALALYRNVKKTRKNRLGVLGEQTYAEYVNGDYQDALGKTVALETPYFQYGFAPDIHLVEIMTRKAMCDFGGAEEGVKRFGERYVRELTALKETLQRNIAPAVFYEELMSYADKKDPLRYQRYLLQLTEVMENQKTMNAALVELAKLEALGTHQKTLERPEGWDEFTVAMRQRWSGRTEELRRVSGETALREASYLAERLRHTFDQVELLDLDISTSAAKNYDLQSALNFPAKKQEAVELKKNEMKWGFDNEIWEDEIDFMKAKNTSKCAARATAASI